MIIFKDLITGKSLKYNLYQQQLTKFFSGDEMFTDSSKVKLVDDCVWEVTCNVSSI